MNRADNGLSARLTAFVESAWVRNFIMGLIILNAVTLGLETYPIESVWFDRIMPFVDQTIITIFVIEIFLKLLAYRVNFFRSGWNWFDVVVITISLYPAAGPLTVLRSLRILRTFRLFSVMPEMRKVVEALLRAIPGMGAIIAVLGLIFYVFSVMATKLFGGIDEEFSKFDTLGESAISLFQVMTLEGWASEVMNPVRDVEGFGWAWVFFVIFIVLTSFAVLNLFIAIIVDSLQTKHFDAEEEALAEAQADREALYEEVVKLREQVAHLASAIQGSSLGSDAGSASVSDSSTEKDADRSE
jgi:voltage-gated sodium channel